MLGLGDRRDSGASWSLFSRPTEQKRIGSRCGLGTAKFKMQNLVTLFGAPEKSPALLPEKAHHAGLPGRHLTLPLLNAVLALPVLSFYLRFLWNEDVRDGAERQFCALWLALGKGM